MTAASVFVTIAIGCIECGVPSGLVGVYATVDEANAAAEAFAAAGDSWTHHGGQGYVEVFGPKILGETEESWAKF